MEMAGETEMETAGEIAGEVISIKLKFYSFHILQPL